jgi:hypothetical protein
MSMPLEASANLRASRVWRIFDFDSEANFEMYIIFILHGMRIREKRKKLRRKKPTD